MKLLGRILGNCLNLGIRLNLKLSQLLFYSIIHDIPDDYSVLNIYEKLGHEYIPLIKIQYMSPKYKNQAIEIINYLKIELLGEHERMNNIFNFVMGFKSVLYQPCKFNIPFYELKNLFANLSQDQIKFKN